MTSKEIAELREWAVKKAAMYDRKRYEYAHQYSAEVNLTKYRMVIDLCDKVLERKKAILCENCIKYGTICRAPYRNCGGFEVRAE